MIATQDCPECKGTGKYVGLNKIEPCSLCTAKHMDSIYDTFEKNLLGAGQIFDTGDSYHVLTDGKTISTWYPMIPTYPIVRVGDTVEEASQAVIDAIKEQMQLLIDQSWNPKFRIMVIAEELTGSMNPDGTFSAWIEIGLGVR